MNVPGSSSSPAYRVPVAEITRSERVAAVSSRGTAEPRVAPAPVSEDPRETQQLRELRANDRLAHQHSRLQQTIAKHYARGVVTYEHRQGPDGTSYAVDGDVEFDTRPVPGDADATLRKAATVRRAALTPIQPDLRDFSVAARAAAIATRARADMLSEGVSPVSIPAAEAANAFAPPRDEPPVLIDAKA